MRSQSQTMNSNEDTQEKLELPYDVIKQIDRIVDQHMNQEFPMKKYVSKREEQAKKKSVVSDHTWSSKLLNAQINNQISSNRNTPSRASSQKRKVDPEEREKAMK